MANSNWPHRDPAKVLLPTLSIIIKYFTWLVFGFFMIGAIAEILGLLPMYKAIMPILWDLLLRVGAGILCFLGFVAFTLSLR